MWLTGPLQTNHLFDVILKYVPCYELELSIHFSRRTMFERIVLIEMLITIFGLCQTAREQDADGL
mgnify:CR=1 FL=1